MKSRKESTLCKLLLGSALLVPFAANAAAPVAFGSSYTNTNGTVTGYVCPIGFTCGTTPIEDDGFLQVSLTENATGKSYFQTIILGGAGEPANQNFSTESFVVVGSGNGGIAVDQTVDDNTGGSSGTLESSNVILTGTEFLGAGEKTVSLTQTVTDSSTGIALNAEFATTFAFNADLANLDGGPVANDRVGVVVLGQTINQADGSFDDSFTFTATTEDVTTADGTTTVSTVTSKDLSLATGVLLNPGGTTADQSFTYDFQSGTATNNLLADTGILASGGTVTWTDGDTIDRVIIAQAVTNAGDFGYASLGNKTSATKAIDFSLAGATSIDWQLGGGGVGSGSDPF